MKLLTLMGFLFYSALSYSYEAPIYTKNISDVESYYRPLKNSNFTVYDNNIGAFMTGFELDLVHQNKDLSKSLKFRYSTHSSHNLGFGIGFELQLSRFYPNPDPLRSNYILEYQGRVVEYQVNADSGYETDLTFFSKLTKVGSLYHITFPDGKVLQFDATNGHIIKEVSSFNDASISYKWNSTGQLEKLTIYNGKSFHFHYQSCDFKSDYNNNRYKSPYVHKGHVLDPTQCLSRIDRGSKSISFTYEDGYLIKAIWSEKEEDHYVDQGLPLFQASYSEKLSKTNKSYPIHGKFEEEMAILNLGEYGVKLIKHDKLLERYGYSSLGSPLNFDSDKTLARLHITDLNHDGVSDLVIESLEHVPGVAIKTYFLGFHNGYAYKSDGGKIPNTKRKKISVWLGMVNKNKNDITFRNDPQYSLPQSFNTLAPICGFGVYKPLLSRCDNSSQSDWDESNVQEYEGYFNKNHAGYYAHIISNSSLLIADFNGDQFVDILHCTDNKKAIVYGGHDKLNLPKDIDIPCNAFSSAQDINHDGLADIITSEKIYLNLNGKFQSVSEESVKPLSLLLKDQRELIGYVSTPRDQTFNVDYINKYSTFLYNYRKKKFGYDYQKRRYVYDNEKKEPQALSSLGADSGSYLFSKESIEYYPTGSLKRIDSYTSNLGATTQVEYTGQGSAPIIKTVTKFNMDKKLVENLHFSQPIISNYNGKLWGYKFVRSVIEGNENFEGVEKITNYYSDNSLDIITKRVPIHGKVSMKAVCRPGSCLDLVAFTVNPNDSFVPLENAERIDEYEWSYAPLSPHFKKGQYYKVVASKSHSLLDQSVGKHRVHNTIYQYHNMSELGPLMTSVTRQMDGIVDKKEYSFNILEGKRLLSSVKTYKGLNQESVAFESLSYNFNPFVVTLTKKVENDFQTTESTTYDNLGRVVSKKSATGIETKLNYNNNELLVVENDFKVKTTKEFDDFGDIISIHTYDLVEKKDLSTIAYQYESVGLMSKIIVDKTQAMNISLSQDKSINLDMTISNEENELIQISKKLDHFGNISLVTQKADEQQSLISKSIYDAAGRVVEDYLPRYNSADLVPHRNFKYDFLGRVVEEKDLISNVTKSWEFSQGKKIYKLNGLVQSQEEVLPMQLQSEIIRGDGLQIAINESFLGIESISFNGSYLKFKQNSEGEIVNVIKDSLQTIFSRKNRLFESTVNNDHYKTDKYKNIVEYSNELTSNTYSYDSENKLITNQNLNYSSQAKYDELQRLSSLSMTSSLGGKLLQEFEYDIDNQVKKSDLNSKALNFDYLGSKLIKVPGFIDLIKYDQSGLISLIQYHSGLKVEYLRDQLGQLTKIDVIINDENSLFESYQRGAHNLITSSSSNFSNSDQVVENSYSYTHDLRFKGETKLQDKGSRDFYLSLERDELSFDGIRLISFEDNFLSYNAGGVIDGYLDSKSGLPISFIDKQLHMIGNTFVKYLMLEGQVIGAFIVKGEHVEFIALVTDVRGSLRLGFNKNLQVVLKKDYDEWGYLNKNNSFALNEYSSLILLDYAGLKRSNFDSPYLISESRVYASDIGEWVSIDPELLTDPKVFTKGRLYEIDGISYSALDPINFVDPSGKSAQQAQFVNYITAGIMNIGHTLKYQAMAAYEGILGLSKSDFTGGGIKPSFDGGILKMSAMLGYDTVTGPEAIAISNYKLGNVLKGEKQFGYSNGGVRLVGRVDGKYGLASSALTLGTSNNVRGKLDFKMGSHGLGVQYNSSMRGRVGFDFGNYRGMGLGVYGNFGLTQESYNHFERSSMYSDWSYSGVPYRGY